MGDFVTVCATSELEPGEGTAVEVEGETVAVFNVDGEFHAISGECTHEGGPLGEAELVGSQVECPWHGARFDVTTGEVKSLPATDDERSYEVRVEGGEVRVPVG